MEGYFRASIGYMILTGILGIVLGIAMLFYPFGTIGAMDFALRVFQLFLSIFIVYYAISEAVQYFKSGQVWGGIGYLVIGVLATLFVWIFDVSVIYWFVAIFLLLSGVGEIVGAFQVYRGSFFLVLLGLINIFVGISILKFPLVLPLIIAWYVLFWGISRLLLGLELRRRVSR